MRKIFAIFFFLILVFPLLFAAQISISVISWALDRDFYATTLDQPVVYTAIGAGPMIDQILANSLRLPPDADTTALTEILHSVLTPEYFGIQISAYVNSLFDYLQGKTTEFSPVIDLKPLKQTIAGDRQDAFLIALVQALPQCAPGQAPGFGSDTETACKPAGIPDELIIEQALKPSLALLLIQVPDQAPLPGELGVVGKDMGWRSYLPGMAAPASIMLSVLVLSFIAVVAWYLIALIADTGWNGRLQWLGWMLLIPSLLVFLLGFAVQGGVAAYWINFGLERAQLTVLPSGLNLAEILQAVATASLPRISDAFKMAGGIGGAFALVFIFWGIATPRTKSA
jgi:hypothetical protein